jgi:formylglycine-generating enzyme required for sulfatase activity
MPRLHPILFLLVVLFGTARTLAQGDPSGIDFVTITNPGNAPWPGNGTPGDRALGRGSVPYDYKIGRYEVTTAQFVDFFNAAFDRPQSDWLPNLIPPTHWGAVPTTPNTPGGLRWTVPAGNEMLPVGNISWRMAAMYCNWLCNDKSAARSAFMNGAYDASTFGYSGSVFTDQLAHNPGAQYWIPTFDEWIKAAHYDPNHDGPGQGGWWLYPNGGDTPLTYGPPGLILNGHATQANAGWDETSFPGYDPFSVPLGAYPVTSPYGLFDVSGGTSEWTEEVLYTNGTYPTSRLFDGESWVYAGYLDRITDTGGDFPSLSTFDLGFRVAAAVPAPPSCAVPIAALACIWRRKRLLRKPTEPAKREP